MNELAASTPPYAEFVLLVGAGILAAILNTLAGGGPLVTLAAMVFVGIDPRIANITSTVALFPSQILTGFSARKQAHTIPNLPIEVWLPVTLAGGTAGALLIAHMSPGAFRTQVPWLVLFATCIYTVNAIKPMTTGDVATDTQLLKKVTTALILFILSVYGGYFGGGNSFLVLALLTNLSLTAKDAGAAKNLLIAVINAAAVALFITTGLVHFSAGLAIASGALLGGVIGTYLLNMMPTRFVRICVIVIGLALSGWLFFTS
jgi:uncharacterized protein